MRKFDYLTNLLLRQPFWVVIISLGVSSSWLWNLDTIEQHAFSLAQERGRYTFKIIEATRLWVAKHGVAYVKTSELSPSNPYLDIPDKDINTPSGTPLTAVNPAYMTRQLSGILKDNHDLYVRLTSLKPLNPNNNPDNWERSALLEFPKGSEEATEVIENENGRTLRYMAPLFVKKACMKCHAKQGYEVGDVRGGISVSFNYEPFIASIAGQKNNLITIHLFSWIILIGFSYFTLLLIKKHENKLEKSRDEAERLVKVRTKELRDEVQIRRNAESKLQLLINSTEEGIFGVDEKGYITFINPAGQSYLGYKSINEVVGHHADDVFQRTHGNGEPVKSEDCQIRAAWENGLSGHSEDEIFTKIDGSSFAVEYHVHPLFSHEEVVGAVVNFSDISLRKKLQESMWKQANYDSLTEIANRSLFLDRLDFSIEQARRANYLVAILYMDLNRFKPINDQYGHEAGDEILRVIARRLKDRTRHSDTVARLGGDEFVILLNQLENRDHIAVIVDELKKEIIKPIDIGVAIMEVGVSIGSSIFPDDADNIEALIAKADQEMYKDKHNRQMLLK